MTRTWMRVAVAATFAGSTMLAACSNDEEASEPVQDPTMTSGAETPEPIVPDQSGSMDDDMGTGTSAPEPATGPTGEEGGVDDVGGGGGL